MQNLNYTEKDQKKMCLEELQTVQCSEVDCAPTQPSPDICLLTSTNNLCFEQEYEKYQNFLSKNFPFLVVKFSIYLNRHVFVMANLALPNVCQIQNEMQILTRVYNVCHLSNCFRHINRW